MPTPVSQAANLIINSTVQYSMYCKFEPPLLDSFCQDYLPVRVKKNQELCFNCVDRDL